MVLIIGGAYQGKLDYAMENYPGKSADIINSLHLLVLEQIRDGIDSLAYLRENLPQLKDKIIICADISCGVVPTDPETRLWRETIGRCLALLSKNADEVVRVFCGIGSRIK